MRERGGLVVRVRGGLVVRERGGLVVRERRLVEGERTEKGVWIYV